MKKSLHPTGFNNSVWFEYGEIVIYVQWLHFCVTIKSIDLAEYSLKPIRLQTGISDFRQQVYGKEKKLKPKVEQCKTFREKKEKKANNRAKTFIGLCLGKRLQTKNQSK